MFSYMSYDNTSGDTSPVSTCPIKRKTDDMGGLKVQVYGLDSYGYLQYSDIKNDPETVFAKDKLHDMMTLDEWKDFWLVNVRRVLQKHHTYDWLVSIWVVMSIFMCTALLTFRNFRDVRLLFGVAVLLGGLIYILSSWPKSTPEELQEFCQSWSEKRRASSHNESAQASLEARFFVEKGPPTRHGRNNVGVIQFLPPLSRSGNRPFQTLLVHEQPLTTLQETSYGSQAEPSKSGGSISSDAVNAEMV